MKIQWTKDGDRLLCRNIPEETNASAEFDILSNELIISEYGKYYDDHAVVIFKVNLRQAEDIIKTLKKVFTG
jgi:hypothetical protein